MPCAPSANPSDTVLTRPVARSIRASRPAPLSTTSRLPSGVAASPSGAASRCATTRGCASGCPSATNCRTRLLAEVEALGIIAQNGAMHAPPGPNADH